MEAAAISGPSPKRRRMENRSVTSPEQIIQTNATVQRILGTQTQRRWMSGCFTTGNSGGSDDTNARSRAPAVQTGEGHVRSEIGSAEAIPQERRETIQTSVSNGLDGSGASARANAGLPVGEAGASQASPTVLAAEANIVEYESPYASNPPSAFAMPTNTTPVDTTTSHAFFPPGLPSPASTDETSRSPTTVGSTLTISMADPPGQPPKRGRPPKQPPSSTRANSQSHASAPASRQPTPRGPPANAFSNTGTGSSYPRPASNASGQGSNGPAQGQQSTARSNAASPQTQQRNNSANPFAPRSKSSRSQQRSNSSSPFLPLSAGPFTAQHRGSSSSAYTPTAGSSSAQQHSSSSNPTTPAGSSSSAQYGGPKAIDITPEALRDLLDEFEQKTPNLHSEVDRGRLALLREAVWPEIDSFYLVLSQLHALNARPQDLPPAVQSLPANCWNTLTGLLASNQSVTPVLLKFLAEFPAPAKTLLRTDAKYPQIVKQLETFLRDLPKSWDGLIRTCQSMQVPPAVEDLARDVKMASRVLQPVAFRAINRMISNAKNDVVSAQLEILHRYDQQAFYSNAYRERNDVYRAFQKLRNFYPLYLQQARIHNQNQQYMPPHLRAPFRPFDLSICPDVALAVHGNQPKMLPSQNPASPMQQQSHPPMQQSRPPSQQSHLPSQQPRQQQQARPPSQQQQARPSSRQQQPQPLTPMQQHQAMVANAQRLNQPYGPSPSTAFHGQPLASPSMAQRQAQHGNVYPTAMPGHPSNANYAMPMSNQPPHGNTPTMQTPYGVLPVTGLPNQPSYVLAPGVTMPAQRHPPNPQRLVFPHESDGLRPQPTEPNPARSALHHAHLRSPRAVPLEIGGSKPLLYRYVCGFGLSPKRIHKGMGVGTFDVTFDLPQEVFAKIPKTQPSRDPGYRSSRALTEDSRLFRLRACWNPSQGFQSEAQWVLADTYWPDHVFVEVNGKALELKRPLHYKKYLPADLSDVINTGTNKIKVAVHKLSKDDHALDFSVAVEMVGVMSHATLLDRVLTTQTVPVAETKRMIAKSAGAGVSGDDEIAITNSVITINLFDPFSNSKIFDIPVRGKYCKHIACFDFETFLSQCKRETPEQATIVDCWKCPICRGDVRPTQMVRDEWLVDVRKVLEKRGALNTRAILVEADGKWKPKPEEKRTGVRSSSLEREERKKKKPVEVIELD